MIEDTSHWHPTSAPLAGRYDDVWFIDPAVGWAVNSSGQILHTEDGGYSWHVQHQFPRQRGGFGIWPRSVTFSTQVRGWVGTLAPDHRLYETKDGDKWRRVRRLPKLAPDMICGLWAVDSRVIYGAGTYDPEYPARVMKSEDGGDTWCARDLGEHASNLIDVFFPTPQRGWVVGGYGPPDQGRNGLRPVVLYTDDGGRTWVDQVAKNKDLKTGEWGWKIQFLNDRKTGFVSLQNDFRAAILRTDDGGKHWRRLEVEKNANIQGVGFYSPFHGWVGGWGDATYHSGRSSGSEDGGKSWHRANQIGKFINRFRFLGQPEPVVAYSGGQTVYKLSADRLPRPPEDPFELESHSNLKASQVEIRYRLPRPTQRVYLDLWNWDGAPVLQLYAAEDQPAGEYLVFWDGRDAVGQLVPPGPYVCRLQTGGRASSIVVQWYGA